MSAIEMIGAVCHFSGPDGKRIDERVENAFVASKSPFFLCLVIPPGKGLWEFLKSGGKPFVETGGEVNRYSTSYVIDVGENTLFFLTPLEEGVD